MVALETGSAAPWPPFPRECLHSGKSWQQKRRWEQRRSRERGTGSAQPRSTQPSPAQPCSARRGSSRWNTPGRCGRGSVPAAEALALPVAPGARGAAVTLARRWSSAPGLCPSSPGGLGGCSSRVKVRSSERQMHNKRFQKGGFLQNPPFLPPIYSPLTCSSSCGCPATGGSGFILAGAQALLPGFPFRAAALGKSLGVKFRVPGWHILNTSQK